MSRDCLKRKAGNEQVTPSQILADDAPTSKVGSSYTPQLISGTKTLDIPRQLFRKICLVASLSAYVVVHGGRGLHKQQRL